MVTIIHRYLFRDLIKSFILATAGLTLILSLGSIIAPVQDYGVSPEQAFKLIICFMPVAFAFVLPVGAVFAAATTYGRFASDNEFDACRAGGISTPTVVYPALCLGLIAAILNILLNFYVVPQYIQEAEVNVKVNIKNLVFRSIQSQGMYEIPDDGNTTYIMADMVDEEKDLLSGVNIIRTADGVVKSLITTSLAKVSFEQKADENIITVVAYDLYQADDSGYAYSAKLPLKTKVASMITDNIRFKELGMLKEIRFNPTLFGPVKEKAELLTARISTEYLAQSLNSAKKVNKWFEIDGVNQRVLLRVDNCEAGDDFKVSATGIELLEFEDLDSDVPTSIWKADTALLYSSGNNPKDYWNLTLTNMVSVGETVNNEIFASRTIRNLNIPSALKGIYNNPDQLGAALAVVLDNPSQQVIDLKTQLNKTQLKTAGAVSVEINYRLAFGLGCAVIVICGAVLGILMKNTHTLTSFGISVIPLAILVVFIMMGKNLTKNLIVNTGGSGVAGIYLIWVGLVVIAWIALSVYKRLIKT